MTQSTRREVSFDHHSATHAADPGASNSALHEHGEVLWSSHYEGFWMAVSHAAVSDAERDNETYSSDHDLTGERNGYQGIVIPSQPFRAIPIEMDPPEYQPYRKLLNPHFSPAAMQRWRPFVDGCVDHFLDRIVQKGTGDLVLDLANPVPGVVTCAILGLPLQEWADIATPAHQLVYAPPESTLAGQAVLDAMRMVQRLQEVAQQRRSEPRDDLISVLPSATIDGEPIAMEMVVQMAFLIVFGGVDTTTGLTANALIWLHQHPDERNLLIAEPDRWQRATEEFLRYFTPVQAQARTVTHETQLVGCPLARGDRILLNFGAANRDPGVYSDPDDMDLQRWPNRHTAFGLGIHRCLGSNLARVMFESMVAGVLRRIPDYSIDHDAARRYQTVGTVNGWECVPATWSPASCTNTELPEPLPITTA